MGKGNGRVFTVAVGNKQSYVCPQVDTAGEELPMKHLLDEVYDKKNPACQECEVCAAFLRVVGPASNVVSITSSPRAKKDVRPPKHNRLHRKTITKTVSVGMGRR